MSIQQHSVVTMTYVLRDKDRFILDASIGRPLMFLQGGQNVIPGLEKSLMGLSAGDRKSVEVPPEEGYGQYNPELRLALPRAQFGDQTPDIGRQVQLSTPDGQPFLATIIGTEGDQVMLDANHPLAGKTLYFDVEILAVREATPEELQHGHPHDPNMPHH